MAMWAPKRKSKTQNSGNQPLEAPHQFRTRNGVDETQRTQTKSNKRTVKSTKLIDIPSLITVWLEVRVLPGPPRSPAFAEISPRLAKGPQMAARAEHPSSSVACDLDLEGSLGP